MNLMTFGNFDSNDRLDYNVQPSSSIKRTSVNTPPSIAAVAGHDIRCGVRSPDITIHTPLDVSTVFWEESKSSQLDQSLEVTVENGNMISVAKRTSWMKHVQLSSNCHTQNMQIVSGPNGNLFLEATRDIRPREPLYAWFSMETSKIFNIPFLSLQNIRGDRHYRCHQCDVHYQNPNPLKIHLAFFCHGTIRPDVQLPVSYPLFPVPSLPHSSSAFTAVRPTCSPSAVFAEDIVPHLFTHVRHPMFDCIGPPTILPTMPLGMMDIFHRSLPYAYEPQVSIAENDSSVNAAMCSLTTATNRNSSNLTLPTSEQADQNSRAVSVTSTSNGRQKRRHKCPYCGKLYSRKYGLKIHVRTHTGYKPLKCKVCLRPFGDPSNLNKHVRLHAEGLTPYRCDLCGKVLVRRRDLDRHLNSRHPNQATHENINHDDVDERNRHLRNLDLRT